MQIDIEKVYYIGHIWAEQVTFGLDGDHMATCYYSDPEKCKEWLRSLWKLAKKPYAAQINTGAKWGFRVVWSYEVPKKAVSSSKCST